MKNRTSLFLIVGISIAVGLLHFVIGPNYNGVFKIFVRSYLIDILLPMNVYLLLQISLRKKFKVLTSRIAGAMLTFLLGVSVEMVQFFDYNFLGSTFDPWDLFMYGLGCFLGLLIDLLVLERFEYQAQET